MQNLSSYFTRKNLLLGLVIGIVFALMALFGGPAHAWFVYVLVVLFFVVFTPVLKWAYTNPEEQIEEASQEEE